jgi:hypothetical protein
MKPPITHKAMRGVWNLNASRTAHKGQRAQPRAIETMPAKVLVVEDDWHVQNVLATMAEELGYEVRRATTAAEASCRC